MSAPRPLTLLAMTLASSGVACTAIVMARLDPEGDYAASDDAGRSSSSSSSGSSSSSSSGRPAELDECSLLQGRDLSPTAAKPDNRCAQCIDQECGTHVELACNRGGSSKESWFTDLKSCAQNPYRDYPDPDSGASFTWGCRRYEDLSEEIAGDTPAARENKAGRCVKDACLVGAKPACALCEVFTDTGDGTKQRLREDACGKCFTSKCEETIVRCCASLPMDDFIAKCAFTDKASNLTKCREIRDAGDGLDAAFFKVSPGSRYDDPTKECAVALGACFNTHCAELPACQAR